MLKKNWHYILFFSLIALLYLWIGSCEQKDDISIHDSETYIENQKNDIHRKKMESEPIKGQIAKADTAQKKAVKKWKQAKEVVLKDTIYKHDTIIQTLIISCDSALAAKDSLSVQKDKLIANLQEENQLHENLENALQAENTALKKQVKKERRKRKLISALGVAISAFLVGIAVTK